MDNETREELDKIWKEIEKIKAAIYDINHQIRG
jgi:hypothetical protein